MSTPIVTTGSAFPVDWNTIADDGVPFELDPMHFPFPVSPLMASTSGAFEVGYTAAMRELNLPVLSHQIRHVNHYRYERTIPLQPQSGQEREAEIAVHREIERMLDRWYIEHRPRLVDLHERLQSLTIDGRQTVDILERLDEVDDIHRELWTIHFRIVIPMLLSMQVFSEFHESLFGESAPSAESLMAGTLTESIKAAFGIAELADLARTLELDGLIAATPLEEIVPVLEETRVGATFLRELRGYLKDYGLRQDLFDFATPTWQEDPTFALANVCGYLETGHDPRAEHAAIVQSTKVAFDATREKLASYPGAVREQFETLVQHARQGAFLQEEHNFYIDQRGLALLRLFYLSVGRRLCDLGIIVQPDDVFTMRIEEIREHLSNDAVRPSGFRTRETVALRRVELEQAARMIPPRMIGDPTAVPAAPNSVMSRAVAAFFGGPPQVSQSDGELRGNPGSKGVATGVARVARTLDEAKAVRPGEILVALTTMPAWTPLFGVAAAIVTETGGALSHCAIVAREYGVPAVVGAYGATTSIVTGQRITVDGSTGVVYLDV